MEIKGITPDYELHETHAGRQQYFGNRQNIIAAMQSIPSQANNYLTMRQRGQLLGAGEINARGYQRPTTGIHDKVNNADNYRLPSGNASSYNAGQKTSSYQDLRIQTEKPISPYSSRAEKRPYEDDSLDYLL